ncbi:caspase Dronc [Stomoxys calcitrans]|uniref:Caspase n=1 Tax=Stomoxys calcitrans TaxID=35570 RepID=A0A1I8NVJ4_STOCA|nr:caspase Dronc [Stomoxys calcitrans]
MDDKHRKLIIDNIERLINHTKFEELSHACMVTGLLSPVMLENVNRIEFSDTIKPMTENEIKHERHNRLFKKITKRGPDAFAKLRQIFSDLKYDSALGILVGDDPYISIHSNKMPIPMAQPSAVKSNPNDNGNLNNNISNETRCSSFSKDEDNRDSPYEQRDRRRSSAKSLNSETTLKEYSGEIRPKEYFDVTKSKTILKHASIDTYPMQTKNHRGVFFMVNMIDFLREDRRDGAEIDTHSLLHLFKELGFKLFSYTNLSHDVFFNILRELLSSEYTKNAECFVMALMTHGNMDENEQRITFSDGSVVKVREIEACFHHHVCKNLVDKPKIFLFPFCRGDMSERGVVNERIQVDSTSFYNHKINNIPQLSDLIVCYATSEGFKAHRDPQKGSWYIQCFVKNMAKNAHDTSFDDILKIIQSETSKLRTEEGQLQTANFVNKSFNKALYFNPGYWLD